MMIQPRFAGTRLKYDRKSWVSRATTILTIGVCLAGGFVPAALADVHDSRSLFVMDRDGKNPRHLVHVESYSWMGSPRWSHDGRSLVFDGRRNDPKHNRCFVVHADGTQLVDVGPGGLADWSPDDKQFAFAGGHSESLKAGIWVQNADGRGRQWLSLGTAPHWSPDGSQIAFQSGGLQILDLAIGTQRRAFERGDGVRGVRFGFDWSPDGTQLAVVAERDEKTRAVVIVEAAGSGAGMRVRLQAQVNDVAWSPDGKTLAVSILDPDLGDHRIHLLSVDGDDAAVEVPGQEGDNREPAWSPDGRQLAFVSSRRDIPWQRAAAPTGEARLELVRSHDKGGTVYSVGLTPDGRTAFVGGDMSNRGVQVWDTTTGDVLRRIDISGIFVAVSPDGRHAASASFIGGDVDYIDLDDGSTVRKFETGAMVVSLDFSGDGSRLVTSGSDKSVCAFDVASGEQLTRIQHSDDVKRVAFSPDGTLIAVTCSDRKLYLWNAETGEKVREIKHPACPWGVAFSPDGRRLMTGTGGALVGKRSDLMVQHEDDNTLRIWDVETGTLMREMKGHTHTIVSVAYSPNGRRAVSASFDHSLRLWDVENGKELSRVEGKGWFTDAVFSFDGTLVLASGGAEKNFEENRWYVYPTERVRLFRIVIPPNQAATVSNQENEP